MYLIWYTMRMKTISVRFYAKKGAGAEPVKDWLKSLPEEDRRVIGHDIKTVEFGWPLGMPLARKLDKDLWEVRTKLAGGRIARTLFTVVGRWMVLLHGFIKKSDKTPATDLQMGRTRRNEVLKK